VSRKIQQQQQHHDGERKLILMHTQAHEIQQTTTNTARNDNVINLCKVTIGLMVRRRRSLQIYARHTEIKFSFAGVVA
jgi:hypothetical protein